MSWKRRISGAPANSEVEAYLKKLGFYESNMSPRFFSGDYNSIINKDAKCLRFDTDYEECLDGTMRIFVNDTDIYVEVQNGYRSLEWNRHEAVEGSLTIEKLDEILDRLTDR